MNTLEGLVIYQKTVELRRKIKQLAQSFSPDEKYLLKSQIKEVQDQLLQILLRDMAGFTIRKIYSF